MNLKKIIKLFDLDILQRKYDDRRGNILRPNLVYMGFTYSIQIYLNIENSLVSFGNKESKNILTKEIEISDIMHIVLNGISYE